MKNILLGLLAATSLGFLVAWLRDLARRRRDGEPLLPSPLMVAIGFITNFFDTLGIGSFAPTTSVYRLRGIVPDEQVPGTLNIGHSPPVIVQAFIFLTLVDVAPRTLVTLIVAGLVGAWFGAGVVRSWPRRNIQVGMGWGLLVAGLIMVLKNIDEMRAVPTFPGGDALGLETGPLVFAALVCLALGALLTLGIGFYAPCLILVSLLGMNPRAAFPIMMGACAFLMPIASTRFITAGSYARRPALGLALGGIPAVLIAGLIVKSLPLTWVRWLVVVVVFYTSWSMLSKVTEVTEVTEARKRGGAEG